ncbi:hypothetical protein [Geobacter sp. OR-1]|uniref:hypothetical protein n=1 Tax=Geobacter sp. OR-1 TaxID=1266765 RepID=UPI001269B95F|nr:hypothetical protein [Geobacter sp. OR-1]
MQKYCYLGFLFTWLHSLLTLLLPLILVLAGSDYILFNPAFNDQDYSGEIPAYTVTQFIYFTLFMVTSFIVANETEELGIAKRCVSILMKVTIFSIVWGIITYVLSFFGGLYPEWLFNNHPGYSHGFDQRIAILRRISSIAQEPSVYGYFLTIMITMVMVFNVLEFYPLKPATQKTLLFIMIITAILTTSTTAFLGIFIAIVLTLLVALASRRLGRALRYLAAQIGIMAVLFAGVFLTVINRLDLDLAGIVRGINELTVEKLQSESGVERSWSFFHGIQVLIDTYFMGSGFASNRTFDLGSTLLANTGIIGLSLFVVAFVIVILFPALHLVKYRCNDDISKIMAGLVTALITALILMFVSVPDFVNMYFWLILGMLMGVTGIKNNASLLRA